MQLWPSSRGATFLVCLFLIDLPVIIAALIIGHHRGYVETYNDISAWRLAHPWSLLPSLLLVSLLFWRRAH